MERFETDLLQLLSAVRAGIEDMLPDAVWLRAEILSLSVRGGGHCYMELVQNDSGLTVAKAKAIIWASVYPRLSSRFFAETGSGLGPGQQVLLHARVNFAPLYGLSLIVDDIDPAYTLGDAGRKRMETEKRLVSEGLVERQKKFSLSLLPRNLAVISAEGAAGYGDFLKHLHGNSYGFSFSTELFPAVMQGMECASSIASALREVELSGKRYDAVLILRGGGSVLDLSCYDEYELCVAIACHPGPVLTAVGHERDVHLCDAVAFEYFKTPTALADFFLEIMMDEDARLGHLADRLDNVMRIRFDRMEAKLDNLLSRLEAASPRRILERGFSIVLGPDDRPLKSVEGHTVGERISILLSDGTLRCRIESLTGSE